MNLWPFRLKATEVADTPDKIERLLRSQWHSTVAGVNVTHESALQVPAVFACLQVLSQSVSMLPFTVYKKEGSNRKKASDSDIYQLLHLCPNNFQSAVEFIRTMTFNAAWRGNAYALRIKSRRRLLELVPLAPGVCTVAMQADGSLEYTVTLTDNGKSVVTKHNQDEIFHLRGLNSLNGYRGESPISYGRSAIATAIAAEKFGGDFFKDGAKSRGAFRVPEANKSLSDQAFDRLKNELNDAVSSQRSPLLEHGIEWLKMDYNPEQSQLTQLRAFQIYEICRLFRIQPHLIQSLDKSTFSNIEHQSLEFVDHTLMPWIRQWESAVSTQLMNPKDESIYPKFSVQALLRGDNKTRADFFKAAGNVSWMTVNEIRELEDMDPVEDGNKIYIPLNFAPVDDPPENPPNTDIEEPEAA